MVHILIADDHAIVRFGLKQMIAAAFTPVTLTEAATFDNVITLVAQQSFDLLILDINLPGGNNLHMIDAVRLRLPSIKVLIFSALDEKLYAINYLQAGADGYLEKSSDESEVKTAISTLLKNEKYLSPATRQQLLSGRSNEPNQQNPFTDLTTREIDVMNLLVKGIPIAKIAEIMNLHISTISTYKTRLFTKLRVNNIVELLQRIKPYNLLS